MIIISQADFIATLKGLMNTARLTPSIPIYPYYTLDSDEKTAGIYVGQPFIANRYSNSAGYGENAQIFQAIDNIDVAFISLQADPNYIKMQNIFEQMCWAANANKQNGEDLFNNYIQRVYSADVKYLSKGNSAIYLVKYELTRLSRNPKYN